MKMPSKIKYNDMIEQLESMVKLYEDRHIETNEYKIDISNGRYILFDFRSDRIAHLLGLSTQGLQESGILTSTTSFGLLKEVIERSIYIYNECSRGRVNYTDLFSPFINEKLSSFSNIIRFAFDDIEFVCQYDPTKAILTGQPSAYSCNYYIAIYNGSNYDFLGLKYDERINRLIPASILTTIENKNELGLLRKIIQGQKVMAVTGIHITPIHVNKKINIKQ